MLLGWVGMVRMQRAGLVCGGGVVRRHTQSTLPSAAATSWLQDVRALLQDSCAPAQAIAHLNPAPSFLCLQDVRALLQSSLRSVEAAELFSQLFSSFSHSCAASLALALLAQVSSGERA